METAPPLAALGSFLLWSDLYLLLRVLQPRWTAEWACRVATTIHASTVAFLCCSSVVVLGPWPFHYIGRTNTQLHTAIVVLTIGYFVFDFAWCVGMQTEGAVMLLHHVVSIFGFSYVLYTGKYGCEISAVLGASEVTNPLLQMRWFLKQTGRYSGSVEKAVDWMFVCLFCSLRLGVGTAFFFCFFSSPDVDAIARYGATAFYIISIVFGIQIMLYMHRKYFKRR